MSNQAVTWPGHQPGKASESSELMTDVVLPQIILPESTKILRAFGDEVHLHMTGKDTGGKYTTFTSITPPGGGPPPHYHNNEDEWFIPLKGRVEFFLDGSWTEVPLRSLFFLPRGTVHTFRNCGGGELELLTHTSPSGFETFFERCADEFSKAGPPDMGRIIEISGEHGIHFVTE